MFIFTLIYFNLYVNFPVKVAELLGAIKVPTP